MLMANIWMIGMLKLGVLCIAFKTLVQEAWAICINLKYSKALNPYRGVNLQVALLSRHLCLDSTSPMHVSSKAL